MAAAPMLHSNIVDPFRFWANPTDGDSDIIFVHGPGGGPETTWTHDKTGRVWPKDMLTSHFPNARIMSFNYQPAWDDFFVLGDREDLTMDRINKLSTDLCLALSTLRQNKTETPLFFIAHCLGGLVCANVLTVLTERTILVDVSRPGLPETREIARCCRGIILLATPFICKDDATIWKLIADKLRVNTTADITQQSGPVLVQQRFERLLLSGSGPKVNIVVEEGDGDSPDVVVTSECVELEGITPVSYPANHLSISKFENEGNLIFEDILKFLKKYESMRKLDYPGNYVVHAHSMRPTYSGIGHNYGSVAHSGNIYSRNSIAHFGIGDNYELATHSGATKHNIVLRKP